MVRFIAEFIICLFAVYGAVCLGSEIAQMFWKKGNKNKNIAGLLLVVKNQEECIEGMIRSIFQYKFMDKILSGARLVVVDMGSCDRTVELLQRLRREYGNMEVLEYDERERAFVLFSHMS